MTPNIPNTSNPPIIPIRVNEVGSLDCFDINNGWVMLSKNETNNPLYNKRSTAGKVWPAINNPATTGTQTIHGPIIGITPANIATKVRRVEFGTPAI